MSWIDRAVTGRAAWIGLLSAGVLATSVPAQTPPPATLPAPPPATLPETPPATPPDVAVPDSTFYSEADTLWGVTEAVVVVGASTSRVADPAATSLDALAVAPRDARSAADLAPLVPAARVAVNSRGESQLMLRGASERHVRLYFDGIPLNIPWDERVDLSLVPADAVAGLSVARGVGSVLDGPNALAGTVELLPPVLPGEGSRTRLSLARGESRLTDARLLHHRRDGAWDLLAAASRRAQDGFLVPEGFTAPFNQSANRTRTNSDLEEWSLLLRARRQLGESGSLRLLFSGVDGEKGVPPETHLDDGARYWRFPVSRRGLLGAALDVPLDDGRRWTLAATAAADFGEQEIRAYDDATYATPAREPGVDYETDHDRTGWLRARVRRGLGTDGALTVQGAARHARHRESLVWDGPELTYTQWLGSLVAEAALPLGRGWRWRGGGGYEFASTPETGDKPARARTDAAVAHARVDRDLGAGVGLHAAVSRRSRFPALRELYSGALGRFVPNPDLAPERQDLLELGAAARRGAWELGLTGFVARVDGPIEKVSLPDRQYQRRNVEDVRTRGLEAVAAWRPAARWSLSSHLTLLDARRERAGEYDAPVEDRPAYVSWVTASWLGPWGLRLDGEAVLTGARESLDATDEADSLRRLPAQSSWNARLAWTWSAPPRPLTRAELFARVNNLGDDLLWSQTGLPDSGRTLLVGMTAWFDRWAETGES